MTVKNYLCNVSRKFLIKIGSTWRDEIKEQAPQLIYCTVVELSEAATGCVVQYPQETLVLESIFKKVAELALDLQYGKPSLTYVQNKFVPQSSLCASFICLCALFCRLCALFIMLYALFIWLCALFIWFCALSIIRSFYALFVFTLFMRSLLWLFLCAPLCAIFMCCFNVLLS